MTTAADTATVVAWNLINPVGTPVRYWSVLRQGDGIVSRTRSLAWNLGHGTPVVLIEGKSGGVALTHVQVLDRESAEAGQ